jgi:glycosyltransferase involved in cell wall biosynthesis
MKLQHDPVALNGRFSGTQQPTGTQTAAFHLYDAMLRSERDRSIVVFADARFDGVAGWAGLPKTTLVVVPFQDWSRHKAQFWEQFVFPRLARNYGCALAHHPITTCPVWKTGMKSVVTVHDLNFHLHPEWYSRSFRLVLHCFALPGIRRADRVVAISDYVRRQLIEHLHLDPDRVQRIYNGVKCVEPLPVAVAPVEAPKPYILCVGSLQPHKNLPRLIRAYFELRRAHPDLELWVAGRPQPRFRREPELADLLHSPGVRLLGYLSETELATAYRDACVFCYPSLEEGFGLPLLEAMQAGTLVVTSQVSCLPEVGGPACEQVDPLSVTGIAAGIDLMLRLSDDERSHRIEQGRLWAKRFSWQIAAREYLDLFEELLA